MKKKILIKKKIREISSGGEDIRGSEPNPTIFRASRVRIFEVKYLSDTISI